MLQLSLNLADFTKVCYPGNWWHLGCALRQGFCLNLSRSCRYFGYTGSESDERSWSVNCMEALCSISLRVWNRGFGWKAKTEGDGFSPGGPREATSSEWEVWRESSRGTSGIANTVDIDTSLAGSNEADLKQFIEAVSNSYVRYSDWATYFVTFCNYICNRHKQ